MTNIHKHNLKTFERLITENVNKIKDASYGQKYYKQHFNDPNYMNSLSISVTILMEYYKVDTSRAIESLTDGTKDVILGSSNGKAVRFNESLVRSTKRAASGVKGIRVAEGEKAIGMCIVNSEEDEIIILTSNGYGKRTSVEDFKVKGRNGKGVKFMNLTEKNGTPVCLKTVTGEDDLMIITDKGMIVRTHLDQISTIGRDTQGVRIISLNDGQTVASIEIVPRSDDDDEPEVFDSEDNGYLDNHGPELADLPDDAQDLVEEE